MSLKRKIPFRFISIPKGYLKKYLNALAVMAIIGIVFASSWELLRIAFVAS
jgi:hypothetical protein